MFICINNTGCIIKLGLENECIEGHPLRDFLKSIEVQKLSALEDQHHFLLCERLNKAVG